MISEASKKFLEETAVSVEEAFDSRGWTVLRKCGIVDRSMKFESSFAEKGERIDVQIFIDAVPKCVRIAAFLPLDVDQTYEYPLCKEIVDVNLNFRYGVFHYGRENGTLAYIYSYPITHGFFIDDFLQILDAVVQSAVDDAAFRPIKKAAMGQYTRDEREEMLKTLKPLIEDLKD